MIHHDEDDGMMIDHDEDNVMMIHDDEDDGTMIHDDDDDGMSVPQHCNDYASYASSNLFMYFYLSHTLHRFGRWGRHISRYEPPVLILLQYW